MSDEINLNILFNQFKMLSPVISAQLLNAYYSALLLKQQQGIELNQEKRSETIAEVLQTWLTIDKELQQHAPQQQETSPAQTTT
jgi:hypothetical protein